VINLREGKNKALNTSKKVQILYVSTDLQKFSTKENKISEYFQSEITRNDNSTLLNDVTNKKKECQSKTVNQDDFNVIELA
jgi:hypothetical protein